MKSTAFQGEKQSYEYNRGSNPAECVVSGALALVLRASRCAGVAPLRFTPTDAGWSVAVSPTLAFIHNILVTVYNLVGLAALILDFCEDPERRIRVGRTPVTAFMWMADFTLVFAIANLAAYRGAARMEKLIRLLNQLQQINVDLNNEVCAKTERMRVIGVVCLFIYILTVQLGQEYMMTQSFRDKGYNWTIMVMYFSYYIVHTLRSLVLLQWTFVALAVLGAATTLNQRLLQLRHVKLETKGATALEVNMSSRTTLVDCFTETHEATSPGSEFGACPWQVQFMLRRLASSHGRIGELIRQMNDSNGVIIIGNLMATFLHLVVSPYYLMLSLTRSDKSLQSALLMPMCWGVFHISILLMTVDPCHRTQAQRETTKFLLSRLTVRLAPKSKMLAHELDQFAKQTVLTNVKFIPLGVLTLGRPLMASMLGGVTTYLVILMQFHALTNK